VNIYDDGLPKCEANFTPMTPVAFLTRSAAVHPDRIAVIHGSIVRTWRETAERARRLGCALAWSGIGRGDTVAVLLPNIPAMVEAHFGVPMTGAVLNALNTRLDAASLHFMLAHGEAKAVLVDRALAPVMRAALVGLDRAPIVIDVDDPEYTGPGERIGGIEYEAFLASADPAWEPPKLHDEWDAICLNYTSGTTGDPKGVVYHHRGAYLNAVSNILEWDLPKHPVFLWTLPMFHCNGWCFPWTIAARAGTNVCLRKVESKAVFDAIRTHRVTHYCGAPIVHAMLVDAPAEHKRGIAHAVHAMVAGAAPPSALFEGIEALGFSLTHVYGLTEVYGPAAVCEHNPAWDALPSTERAVKAARQGVPYHLEADLAVLDPETHARVPADGVTMGEVAFRGNIAMKGYLKNPHATRAAFAGGWFHTGDLGVVHPDGYIKLKDRAKDIIISGGENISSLEIEDVLARHPAVLASAVVAKPDPRWGETPCAFVELRPGHDATTAADIIAHCRANLAGFKVPRAVVFGTLPKTSTGKIQKFELRKRVGSATAVDV